MPRSEKEVAIEVRADSVRRGDSTTVGGQLLTVQDLVSLPGGAKRIEFGEGVALTLRPGMPLVIFRMAKGW